MSHLGDAHHQELKAYDEIPTRATGVPQIVLQQSTPLSGGATSLSNNLLKPGANVSGDLNIRPGKIQIRELFPLASPHDKSNHASCRTSIDGDCGDNNHHYKEDRIEYIENVEVEPWIKLTTEEARSTVAEFMPLNRGFSFPSLNPFGVEFQSGILDRGPNQSIYFSRGHPISQPTNRECPLCKYVDHNNREVHVILPDSISECPRCAFVPLMFTPKDLQEELLNPRSSNK